jgi:hypothetical protein
MIQPQFFGVVQYTNINLSELGFVGIAEPDVCFILFTIRNLEDPNTEPIGLFYTGGTRRYIWRDKYWGEAGLAAAPLIECVMARLRDTTDDQQAEYFEKVLVFLKEFKDGSGPTLIDNTDCEINRAKVFYRVIYEIKE